MQNPFRNVLAQFEMTPSQVNEFFGELLKGIGRMTIVGEVKSVSEGGSSGHLYYAIADPEQSVQCVTWKSQRQGVDGTLKEGTMVKARVQNPYFMNRKGEIKLNVVAVEALGAGDLQKRAEEVKALLTAEGLTKRKRPLPYMPRAIGLISGRDSEGQADALRSIFERFPAHVVFCGSLVQGVAAVAEITQALRTLEAHPDVDVIVLARGGGSPEDLAVFNEESLARALFACQKPVVVALGHTRDVHVADLVADFSCHVPAEVGEAVVPDFEYLGQGLAQARLKLSAKGHAQLLRDRLASTGQGLDRAEREVSFRLGRFGGTLDGNLGTLIGARALFTSAARDLAHTRRTLKGLDSLGRGFAVVLDAKGTPVVSAGQLEVGEHVRVRLRDGAAAMQVEGVEMEEGP